MEKVRKISKKYYLRQVMACWMACWMVFGTSAAMAVAPPPPGALPTGENVVAGSVDDFIRMGANLDITEVAHKTIIEWDSFSIGADALTEFHFQNPGINPAVLNRIMLANPSLIFGKLNADGRVFIVNPAGIVFGNGARVNVTQLVASSLNISNEDFTNGIYQFSGGGMGEVANYGQISAEQVALIGKKVFNAGVIRSPNGYVLMAAGDRVFLGTKGSDIVVEVDAVTVPENPPTEGIGDVINEGTIDAAGGKVVLAAGDTFSRAIEGLDGLSVAVEGGTGRVGQFGTINVDGIDGDGGSVTLTAADIVALSSDSVTTANAGTNGDGGDVVVYSPDTAIFAEEAQIEAKGGSQSGDGGFVEVSGKRSFEIWGFVDTTAPFGATGMFLIDPTNITISSSSTSSNMLWHGSPDFQYYQDGGTQYENRYLRYSTLKGQLATTNVEVLANEGGKSYADGWIKVTHDIEWDSDNSLTLTATAKSSSYIGIYDPITNTGSGNLTLNAGGYIDIDDDITLDGGSFIANAGQAGGSSTIYIGDDIRVGGDITLMDNVILNGSGSSKRDQDLEAGGTFWAQGTIHKTNSGDVYIESGPATTILDGTVTVDEDDLTLAGGTVTTTGTTSLTLDVRNNINIDAEVDIDGALEAYAYQGDISVGDDITAGSIFFQAGNPAASDTGGFYDATSGTDKTLRATNGDVIVRARESIDFGGDVIAESGGSIELTADSDMLGKGNLNVDGLIDASGDVSLTGRLVTLDDVHAGGSMMIKGLEAIKGYEGDTVHVKGTLATDIGDIEIMVMDTINTGGGELGYLPDGQINLEDNVTAGHDLILYNNTDVLTAGKKLEAGHDVILANGAPTPAGQCDTLTGTSSLTIKAGHEIQAENTVISVSGSDLTLQQGLSIDTADFLFANQGNTNLTLISDNESVTSTTGDNAANKWKSIGAHADESITLARSDGKNEITLGDSGTAGKSLWAENGYIDIDGFNVENSADFADWDLEAGTWLSIDVVHGIDLGGDVTTHSGDMELLADTDTRYGHDVVVAGNIDSGGTLDIEGTNVEIQSAQSVGDMDIYAHGLYDKTTPPDEPLIASGDVHVHGTLTTTDGHIIIEATDFGPGGATTGPTFASPGDTAYSASGTIYLHDDVTANGSDHGDDVRLLSNTVASDNIKIKAYDDVYLKNDKSITGEGDLYIEAGDNIELGQYSETDHSVGGSGGAVTTAGNLDMDAGDSVYANGKLMTTGTAGTIGNGDMTVEAGDHIYLKAAPVSADAAGHMILAADTDDGGVGDVDVEGNLLAGGDIEISASDSTIYLAGDLVKATGNVTLNNKAVMDGPSNQRIEATTGKLTAKDWVHKTTAGDLDMFGGFNGIIAAPDWDQFSVSTKEVKVDDDATNGKLTIEGNAFVWLDGDIYARGDMTLASNVDADKVGSDAGYMHHDSGIIQSLNGEVDISASGSWIHLYGGNPTEYVTAGEDILLRDSTYIVGNRKLDAGDDVVLAATKFLSYYGAGGTLTVEAGDDIILGVSGVDNHWVAPHIGSAGNVTSNGDLILTAGDDIYAHGWLQTLNGGNITGTAVDNIMLYGTPDSAMADGTLSLTANTGAGTGVLYAAGNLTGNMYLSGYDVTVYGNVTSYGPLDVDAVDDIKLERNVSSVGAMTMDAGDNIELNTSSGDTTSGSTIDIYAGDDITIGKSGDNFGNVTANGDMNIKTGNGSGDDITVWGKLTTTNGGNIDVRAGDDIEIWGTQFAEYESVDADGTLTMIANTSGGDGDLTVHGNVEGNMYLSGYDVTVSGNVTSYGPLDVDADNNIRLRRDVSSAGDMTMAAGDDIRLNEWSGNTTSGGQIVLNAGQSDSYGDVDVYGELRTTNPANGDITVWAPDDVTLHDDVSAQGRFEAYAGQASYIGKDSTLRLKGNATAESMYLRAGNGDVDGTDRDNVEVAYGKDLRTTCGDLVVRADDDIYLGGDATSAHKMCLYANADHWDGGVIGDLTVRGNLYSKCNMRLRGRSVTLGTSYNGKGNATSQWGSIDIKARDYAHNYYNTEAGDVTVWGALKAFRDVRVRASDDIEIWGTNFGWPLGYTSIIAGDDIYLSADRGNYPYPYGGDLMVHGNLFAGGDITLDASDSTIYLWGDTFSWFGDIWFKTNVKFEGRDDQSVWARHGSITADGWLNKINCWSDGSLYLHAAGDIILNGHVKAAMCCGCCSVGGGVSIISDDGSIFTEGAGGYLNVDITGRSDDALGVGVDLPYGPGKAAILIMSAENLMLGPDGKLKACGKYYTDGSVDDRYGINFLDYDGSFPPGTPRDQGDPFDLAIYVASTTGNVDVSAPVEITSTIEPVFVDFIEQTEVFRPDVPCYEHVGAMVIDAYDTVTFDAHPDGQFENSLAGDGVTSDVGDRLEVCSRISEWLEDAVGRLPYVLGGGPFVPGYNYVLRGAGAGNPAIGDGAPAWVLENMPSEAAPLGQPQLPTIEGCPAETEAAAAELGMTPETIQVAMGEALALNPDIHPCQACARLLDAAAVLRDEDGSRMAATLQAFNTLAPADAPFTPEMGASIAMAFGDAAEGTQYASVAEYIDAFVEYVTVLETELGAPVGDSTVFAMEKYGTGITEDPNPNLAAFVATRLEGRESFRGL